MLKRPHIKAYVRQLMEIRISRIEVDQDWVVARLKREATYTGPGSSHGARVAALKLLGQHTGGFSEKLEVTNNGPGLVDLLASISGGKVIDATPSESTELVPVGNK